MKNADYRAFNSELSQLFRNNSDLKIIFDDVIRMVTDFIECDAGSVYIYDEGTHSLILTASREAAAGPDRQYRIKISEGLAGLSIRESRVIYEKYVSTVAGDAKDTGGNEENLDSVLVLPVLRGLEKIGVLVLARYGKAQFSDEEINASKIIAGHLADLIDARFMLYIISHSKGMVSVKKEEENFFRGRVISEGYRCSGIYIFNHVKQFETFKKMKFNKVCTKKDFLEAVRITSEHLGELQKKIKGEFSEASSHIFQVHLMILKDMNFTGEIERLIDGGENAPSAVIRVASGFISKMQNSANQYIAEKANDIEDIAIRILRNLLGETDVIHGVGDKIVIARSLLLSDLIRLYSEKAGGLILLEGGITSHLSILARTLKIPTVISDNPKLLELPLNSRILLDAVTGNIYINPTNEVVASFSELDRTRVVIERGMKSLKNKTETRDGVRISLMINVNLLIDLKTAEKLPYDGIGLYRTEFPFLIRRNFPDEETQYQIYKRLVEGAHGREVIFRTLDIGGDKILPYYNLQNEKNPFLGMRSIRFSLENRDIFRQQLRAMLRAGEGADIKIMFPMVSSLEEFNTAREIAVECGRSLSRDKIPHNGNPKIGMMVEVPSVVEIINDLVKVCDFFSIGTNDLIQYILAVDRTNEKTSGYYIAHHPAVLKSIHRVISSCVRHGRDVSICGDMANNKKYTAFLLGSGIRSLSVEPSSFPAIQEEISKTDTSLAKSAAGKILRQSSVKRIEEILTNGRA